jgi:hypothetical protein
VSKGIRNVRLIQNHRQNPSELENPPMNQMAEEHGGGGSHGPVRPSRAAARGRPEPADTGRVGPHLGRRRPSLAVHQRGALSDTSIMALEGHDAPSPDPEGPRRIGTVAFGAMMAAIAVLAWFARVERQPWAWVVILACLPFAPWFRKRWREPVWLEASMGRGRVWLSMGWVFLVIGTLLVIVASVNALHWFTVRQYGRASSSLVGAAIAIGLVAGGRWLIRNRRQPFTSTRGGD